MIHMGQTMSPLSELLALLKRGDIVTHMFAPPPNSIVDDSGRILPEVLAARRRGVWFDIGNGQTGHMRWDTIGAIMKAGFWPDTFSTDWNTNSRDDGRDRSSQLHVEAARLRHDGQRSHRARHRQRRAHLPGVQRPRHAQRGRAGRRGACSSCARERSSSSTTTRARSRDARGSSPVPPCSAASGSRAVASRAEAAVYTRPPEWRRLSSFPCSRYLRPRVLQRDRPVEHRRTGARVGIHAEVAEPLELEARAGRGVRERRLDAAAGHPRERRGIQVVERIASALAGIRATGTAGRRCAPRPRASAAPTPSESSLSPGAPPSPPTATRDRRCTAVRRSRRRRP